MSQWMWTQRVGAWSQPRFILLLSSLLGSLTNQFTCSSSLAWGNYLRLNLWCLWRKMKITSTTCDDRYLICLDIADNPYRPWIGRAEVYIKRRCKHSQVIGMLDASYCCLLWKLEMGLEARWGIWVYKITVLMSHSSVNCASKGASQKAYLLDLRT